MKAMGSTEVPDTLYAQAISHSDTLRARRGSLTLCQPEVMI